MGCAAINTAADLIAQLENDETVLTGDGSLIAAGGLLHVGHTTLAMYAGHMSYGAPQSSS